MPSEMIPGALICPKCGRLLPSTETCACGYVPAIRTKPALVRHFGVAYLINLDRRLDRLRDSIAECSKLGVEIGAVHGMRSAIDGMPSITGHFVERRRGYDHPTNGNAGCTRSHRDVLRKIANGPHERALVLEDDFKVLTFEDFQNAGFFVYDHMPKPLQIFASVRGTFDERLDAIMVHVPDDWDVLYLGGGYAAPPLGRISKHCIRNAGMMTTSSYAITRKHARVWTDAVDAQYGADSLPAGPIDSIFQSFAREHRYYTIQPRLFIQREGKSDLNGAVNSYLNSMTDSAHELMV